METVVEQQKPRPFIERRGTGGARQGGPERRQFSATPNHSNPDVTELSNAVDQYKMCHRRRFITFEELLTVIQDLGYHK